MTRSLLTVAQCRTITDAARILNVTQPALSRRIQQLEDNFGVALFERSRKGMTLTEMGRMAVREGALLVERYDRLKDDVRSVASVDQGRISVGGGATAISYLVPSAIATFSAVHPNIRFHVKEAGSDEIEADVISERLELGLVTLPIQSRELSVRPLKQDHIVLIASRRHRLSAKGRVSPSELSGEAFVAFEARSAIRELIDRSLQGADIRMDVVMELRSIPAMIRMVETTHNLAFVSALAVGPATPDVVILKVRGLSIKRRLGIITKRDRALSPAAQRFSRML
ncbi:MAG: LysR family transcriptional regulator [Gammaproteobacteria bacterium]|nr:LysR family transcriptional regulator [Gammaproteobacteria bacterium]